MKFAALDPQRQHRLIHRWIRFRILGWTLIGVWQVLSLASEFAPVVDLEQRPVRIAGKVIGLLGLFLVACGFERLMVVEHRDARLVESNLVRRLLRRPRA